MSTVDTDPAVPPGAAAGCRGGLVDRHEAWGLVARLPGREGGPTLMLNTHVDVVPPGREVAWSRPDPFSGLVDATSVHGRGACDMKGGLVAAHWAARAIAVLKVPLAGDLLLACVQGEEDGGLGTFATLQRGWRADACIIPEPTSLDISPGNAGSLTFRLHVPGLATHASRRTSGVSAIEKFLPVFGALRRLEAERNVDPHHLMEPWDIADPWLREHPPELEWWGGQFSFFITSAYSEIITTLRRAHDAVSGYRQQTWASPYGSDLRLLTGIGGIPTVHYGPGNARLAHSPDESVPIAEVLTAARALALVVLQHCAAV